VIRTNDERVARIPFNYDKVSGEQENFYLRNGDIVLVP